jgi:hypothetical protein
MIARHVDLIAIGLLLLAMAFFAQVRRATVLELNTQHRVGFSHRNGSIILVPPRSAPTSAPV